MASDDVLDQVRLNGDVPRHVAIIMDGNGRWARQRGLPRHLGHREGMKSVREVIEGSVDVGIGVLTLFAFSTENWQRPQQEVSALMSLLQVYARREREELRRQGVEVHVLGELDHAEVEKLPHFPGFSKLDEFDRGRADAQADGGTAASEAQQVR